MIHADVMHMLVKFGVLGAIAVILIGVLMFGVTATDTKWHARIAAVLVILFALVALFGCDAPVNPVRYQTVEVLVTRPCYAGKTPPAAAIELTAPICTLTDAECVRAAKADITSLKSETEQYRRLLKECSQ